MVLRQRLHEIGSVYHASRAPCIPGGPSQVSNVMFSACRHWRLRQVVASVVLVV